MTDDLHPGCPIHLRSLKQFIVNAGNSGYIHDCRPPQILPGQPQPLSQPHMFRRLQQKNRFLYQPQIGQQRIYHTSTVEQAECNRIYKNPADEIRKRGYSLHKLSKRNTLDFIQEHCKKHGQPGGSQRNGAHGKSVFQHLQQLIDLDVVFNQGFKPFQPHKLSIRKRPWRSVIIKCIDPAIQRIIGKNEYKNEKWKYKQKQLYGIPFLFVCKQFHLHPPFTGPNLSQPEFNSAVHLVCRLCLSLNLLSVCIIHLPTHYCQYFFCYRAIFS